MDTISVQARRRNNDAKLIADAFLGGDAIRELLLLVDKNTRHVIPEKWLFGRRHAKLIDGFTATMPDTPENQAAFPQSRRQKPGVGFPILRDSIAGDRVRHRRGPRAVAW